MAKFKKIDWNALDKKLAKQPKNIISRNREVAKYNTMEEADKGRLE